jgi:hypothetical protein
MMELNQWGRPVFRPQYLGRTERNGIHFFNFSKPGHNISRIKFHSEKNYTVGFVTWFNNLYVDYIVVETDDYIGFLRRRLTKLIAEARTKGWNKRLTAEVEAISLILNSSDATHSKPAHPSLS